MTATIRICGFIAGALTTRSELFSGSSGLNGSIMRGGGVGWPRAAFFQFTARLIPMFLGQTFRATLLLPDQVRTSPNFVLSTLVSHHFLRDEAVGATPSGSFPVETWGAKGSSAVGKSGNACQEKSDTTLDVALNAELRVQR